MDKKVKDHVFPSVMLLAAMVFGFAFPLAAKWILAGLAVSSLWGFWSEML